MTSQILKLALATAALAVSAPVFAKGDNISFQRDGYTYVYQVKDAGNAKQIRGKYYPGGRSFALNVRNGRVEGNMNGAVVAFPLAEVEVTANNTLASAN